jgi:hypothetical protein
MKKRTLLTYLHIAGRMSIYMVLCVEKILDLGCRSINVDPTLTAREAESITRKPRVDEPVDNSRDGLLARCKSVDNLCGCKMLAISRRLRVGHRHEHLFYLVGILLNETKTHWQHSVRVQAINLGPMSGFSSPYFMHNMARAG